MTKATDTEYRDVQIVRVESTENGWSITTDDGWSFYVGRNHGVQPYIGQTARFYGRGPGSPVRGLDIDGREVFYRTPDEEHTLRNREAEDRDRKRREEFASSGRTKLDASYATLPKEFKDRLDGLRRRNANFRWKYESYEMFVCEQAVTIATALRAVDDIGAFHKLPWEKQKARLPDLSNDHSGNTFGAAMRLASLWISHPELVEQEHGALCPLVGCRDYGCAALEFPENMTKAKEI